MRRRPALRHVLLPLVAVALLVAQGIGLRHRIEHGGPAAWVTHSQAALVAALDGFQPAGGDSFDPAHHCAAFDSHTLAEAPPAWLLPCHAVAARFRPLATVAAQQLVAPSARPFDARAPPLRFA